MSQNEEFNKKILELEAITKTLSEQAKYKGSCVPLIFLGSLFIPLIIGFGLYYTSPSIVVVKDNGKTTTSKLWVTIYSFLISAVIWAGLYIWAMCKGIDVWGSLCFVN